MSGNSIDHTYLIDKIHIGYENGINSGTREYPEEEGYFKFYANTYDESVIEVEIGEDEKGTFVHYTYYGNIL